MSKYFILFLLSFTLLSNCSLLGIDSENSALEEEEEYQEEEEEEGEEYSEEDDEDDDDDEGVEVSEEEDEEYQGEEADNEVTMQEEGDQEDDGEYQYIDDDYVVMDEGEEVEEVTEQEIVEPPAPDLIDTSEEEIEIAEAAEAEKTEETSPQFPQRTTATKTWIPLKKIKETPYKRGGFLVNAVYIARSDQTLSSISRNIFNSDQVEQLYQINPHFKNRSVKVGDKIYYQSPRRPTDESQILFYFEDIGATPSYRQVQPGDNIREIAYNLLKHQDGWKEIWATNSALKSKGVLKDSYSIKYWASSDSAPPENFQQATPEPPVQNLAPEPPVQNLAPEAPIDMAENPEGAESLDYPEEKTSLTSPATDQQGGEKTKEKSLFPLHMEIIIPIILLILAIGLLFIIRKKQKKKEYDFTKTNFRIDD